MIVVIDVSAAVEILLQKQKKKLFHNTYTNASWVLAPDLYISEISNVFWKYYKANVISHEDCIQYVEDGIQMVDDFIEAKELWKEALGEGMKHNHSIYDMYYSVLARRNDALLMTNDGALTNLCKELRIGVCN